MAILINAAAVLSAADQIDATNKQIRDEWSNINTAIGTLQRNWEGSAADSCRNKYDYIKNNFSDVRFSVVNDFASFLKNQVGEGYKSTEQAATKAAAAFK